MNVYIRILICLWVGLVPFFRVSGQTRVVKSESGFVLMRNGQPYYVKGAGGETNLDKIVEIGGNSIRTWGTENAQQILDEAQKKGLSVMLGMWLQTERQGFDYNDTEKVEKQFNFFKTIIQKYKNHPALLFWGIGNELDLQYTNIKVWNAVEDLARYIHENDPNHPTSTVTAGIDSMKVQYIKKMCPDIDIFGINTYGDIGSVPLRIGRYGWDGPYMITEWGPNGYWESPNTAWNVSIEQTSSEKKQVYYERYTKYIEPYKDHCLGSYAFFWGGKQEYTETWFGLFSKDDLPTEAVDALELAFTGKAPANPAPTILKFTIQDKAARDNIHLKAGNKYPAEVIARIGLNMTETADDTGRKFIYRWKILAESTDKRSGGDVEQEAREIQSLIRHQGKSAIVLRAPMEEGAYRLFIGITFNNKVAYANIPFYVDKRTEKEGQARFIEFKKQDMDSFNP